MNKVSVGFDSVSRCEKKFQSFQKVEKKYEEFGEVIGDPYLSSSMNSVVKVAVISTLILAVVAIGAASGALQVGLSIGVAILLAVVVYKIATAIFRRYNAACFRLSFEPGKNNIEAPKLGVNTLADLRISNHATESFEWKKTLIESAEKSIELSANFAGGEPFREVLQLIERRMHENEQLKVHLILSRDLLEHQDVEYIKSLKSKYSNFFCLITDRIYTVVPELMSEENHVKMLVIDGKYFVMGGTGVNESMIREIAPYKEDEKKILTGNFIDRAFRDTDIIGYGAIAQTMRNQFFNLYRIWEHRMTGKAENRYFELNLKNTSKSEINPSCPLFHEEEGLIRNCKMKYIVCGPEHRKKNPISSEMARLMRESYKEIRIANLLFNPDKIVRSALERSKENGVRVMGYFNGVGKNSSMAHYLYALPNRLNYDLLTGAYEGKRKNQLYHKKVTTIDGRYSVVGSYNLGVKSSICDYESVVVIDDARVTAVMNKALDIDARSENAKYLDKDKLKEKQCRLVNKIVSFVFGTLFG